jgi:hypothetical protein
MEKTECSKRWHLNYRRQGIVQNKAYGNLDEINPSSESVYFNLCNRTLLLKHVSCEKEQSIENIYVKERVITFF